MSRGFAEAAEFFKILSNPLRLRMLYAMASGGKYVGQLARICGVKEGCISQHLVRLRAAGLVDGGKKRQRVYYKLTAEGTERLHQARQLIERMAEKAEAEKAAAGAGAAATHPPTPERENTGGKNRVLQGGCA